MKWIFKPSFWIMNERYSEAHDKFLNRLMANNKFVMISKCRAKLGNVEVWIANFPYGVGIYDLSNNSRPSRNTIYKMGKKLEDDIISQMVEDLEVK